MINYSLPNFDGLSLELNILFAQLFKDHPDWIQPGICIKSVYGSIPNFDLNGGRAYVDKKISRKEMERCFSLLGEYGIFPRITCTNKLVTTADLDEPYTKRVLETAAKYKGQAIVYIDEIGKEIKKRYGMPIVLTTNRHLKTAKEVNDACENYDMVVLNLNNHKDETLLNQIKYPERIETMANEMCVLNCEYREKHSLSESKLQLAKKGFRFCCEYNKKRELDNRKYSAFTPEEIQVYSKCYGVKNFKIVGRERKIYVNYTDIKTYIVLPKHYNDANNYFKENFSKPDALRLPEV